MKISYIELKKYKYELSENLIIQTKILGYEILHPFFELRKDGLLTIFKGYKWDGVSGPMWDSKNTFIGGCVHDCGYQMIRMEIIPLSFKPVIDNLMRELFIKCKMTEFRANYAHWGVDSFGKNHCIPGDLRLPKTITLEC